MAALGWLLNLDFAGSGVVTITCAVSGTADGATETQIRNGGRTIILELTDDTWLAAGTGPIGSIANTQAIIDGITSAQSEAAGWNAEVRDKEVVASVVRTSNTVATITLSAAAGYSVTADEEITVTVPAAALTTSAAAVVASPKIDITAEAEADTGAGSGKQRAPFWSVEEWLEARRPPEPVEPETVDQDDPQAETPTPLAAAESARLANELEQLRVARAEVASEEVQSRRMRARLRRIEGQIDILERRLADDESDAMLLLLLVMME